MQPFLGFLHIDVRGLLLQRLNKPKMDDKSEVGIYPRTKILFMNFSSFKLYHLALLFLAFATFSSCGDDDDDNEPMELSIVETAQGDEDLSTLVAALTQADLVTTLSGDGPFTVFAPSNAAFQALLDGNPDWNALTDIPNDVLTSVLTFHVLSGEVLAADLSTGYETTLSTGPNGEGVSLQVDTDGGVTFNNSATPTATDISTTNGVVHKINQVMVPKNIVELAQANPNFSTLVAALTDSRHTVDFVGTLVSEGPFTVFAPTNEAFQALLDSDDNWNSLADIDIDILASVLSYHVVSGANVQSSQLTDGQEIEAFSGGTLTIDLDSGVNVETTGGQSVPVVVANVQGTNGVIHGISSVLLAQ